MLLTNHILLYTRLTYVEPYQNILEHFSRKCSSGDWYNEPIRLHYLPLYGQTFYPYISAKLLITISKEVTGIILI